MASPKKRVLHVGCGAYAPGKLHPVFDDTEWDEIRLDIDPDVQPDIVATVTDMAPVEEAGMNAVYSSHNLEHLYPHEVQFALREIRRVLSPDGFALIPLPDLQSVAQLVADGRLADPAYMSGLGPITPLDMLYGFRPALARGNLFMAHHTGFTGATLTDAVLAAGFAGVTVQRHPSAFSLWAIAFHSAPSPAHLRDAQMRMFPLGAP